MIVLLKYKDKQGWISVEGISTPWTNYSKKYKEGRVVDSFFAPEVITDTWNGKESDVQHVKWDVYKFQFNAKESEAIDISSFKSCSDFIIIQYNDNGSVINTTYTLDTAKADYIGIEEPENIGNTSASTYTITFRTNRTIINKGNAVELTNNITIKSGTDWEAGTTGTIPGRLDSFDPYHIASLNGDTLKRYKWDGSSWEQEGNTFVILGLGSATDVCALDGNSVAVIGDGQGRIAKLTFSNGNFTQIGNTHIATGLFTEPSITSLSDDTIVIYDTLAGYLGALDFDGTDWATVGNSLVVAAGAAFAPIGAMTSSKVAMFAPSELRDYDWNGTDFTLNETIALPVAGVGDLCALDSTRISIFTNTDDTLRSYTLGATWTLDTGALVVASTSFSSLAPLNPYEVFLTCGTSGNYNYSANIYYSDYDVINYNRDTENILVPWSDGTQKIAQKIDNSGVEYLQYLNTEQHDNFLKQIKESTSILINGTEVTEVMPVKTQIAEDYYRIAVSGITLTTTTVVDLGIDQTNKLELLPVVTPYYSDYELTEIVSEIEPVILDWFNGTRKKAQTIDKPSIAFTLFLDNDGLNEFVSAFKKATTVEINDVAVTEEAYTVEIITPTLNKVVLSGVQSTTVTDFNLSPSNTYNIVVTDGSGAHTYYTDYKPEFVSETPEIDPVKNETGINTTVKSLSKQVVAVKLYLDEADAFELKAKFEEKNISKTYYNGSINVPVLEERDVSPEKIGVDLYEVICNCLIGVEST